MKKILSISLIMLLLTLASCNSADEEKDYEVGDKVTLKGIEYEYVDFKELDEENLICYSSSNKDLSYHDVYYVDMTTSAQNDKMNSFENNGDNERQISLEQLVVRNFLYETTKVVAPTFYFENLTGFLAVGYTAKAPSNVVIPESIGDVSVIGAGYNAFNGASFETISFLSELNIVLPYAFSECDDLTSIKFNVKKSDKTLDQESYPSTNDKRITESNTVLMSCAISNCDNLVKVDGFNFAFDASFNNLQSLKEVVNAHMYRGLYNYVDTSKYTGYLYDYISDGLNKALFYKCPNIEMIAGTNVSFSNNVFYFSSGMPIYLKEDAEVYLNDIQTQFKLLNSDDTMILPYLNVGYKREFTTTYDLEEPSNVVIVDNKVQIPLNSIESKFNQGKVVTYLVLNETQSYFTK